MRHSGEAYLAACERGIGLEEAGIPKKIVCELLGYSGLHAWAQAKRNYHKKIAARDSKANKKIAIDPQESLPAASSAFTRISIKLMRILHMSAENVEALLDMVLESSGDKEDT